MSALYKLLAAGFIALMMSASWSPAMAQHEHDGTAHDHEHGEAHEHGDHEHGDHADAGHHGGGLTLGRALSDKMTLGAILNFGLMMFIVVYFGRKPIKSFLESRRERISADYTDAQQLKEEALAAHKEHSERLAKLDSEKKELHDTMVKAGAAEKDRIVAEAKEKAGRLAKDTDFVAEQRQKQLKGELSTHSINAAVKAAEALLISKTTEADQVRLAEDFIKQLEREAKQPASKSTAPEARA